MADKIKLSYLFVFCLLPIGLLSVNIIYPSNSYEFTLMDQEQTSLEENHSQYHAQDENPGIETTAYYWEKIDVPGELSYYSFAIHPNDAYTVVMGTSNGIYKTDDAGDSWTRMEHSPEGDIFKITISQSNPNRIFGTYYTNLFRSDDGGESWPYTYTLPTNCGLSVAPSNADRIYCRNNPTSEGPSIFRSNNGGETWITPNISFSNHLIDLAIAPDNPDILVALDYTGIFRSIDGGVTWDKSLIVHQREGKLIFNPTPPYLLYMGNSNDLYRSQDYGASWEVAGLYSKSAAFGISPFSMNEIIGATNFGENGWRIESGRYAWNLTTWITPKNIYSFLVSNDDDRAIYANAGDGLWRHIRRTTIWSYAVYLPIIQHDNDTASIPISTLEALDRSNYYREQVGGPSININSNLSTAAQNHADYYLLNENDPSAWINGPHGEVKGKPGFTGEDVGDRLVAAGYAWGGGFEVIAHTGGDPSASVDLWMSSVYHREPFLDPFLKYAGYGIDNVNYYQRTYVMDFGLGPPQGIGNWITAQPPLPQPYPVNGQTEVPTKWNGGENPDPLPPGAALPVGYPFTLFGFKGLFEVDSIEMRDSMGQLVLVHPNPPDCHWSCYALIPVNPLQPNTTYLVNARGRMLSGDEIFEQTWTFTTGSE